MDTPATNGIVTPESIVIHVVAVQHHRNHQQWAVGLRLGEETKVITGFRLDVKESTLKWAQRVIDREEAYEAAVRVGFISAGQYGSVRFEVSNK